MAFLIRVTTVAALAVFPSVALAQNGAALDLELNKAADVNGACRATFVADNALGQDLDKLSLDVVVFDGKGEVSQRLLLDLGRMPKDKTKVVDFDLPNTSCSKITRLLLNQVQDCTAGGKDVAGCAGHVNLSSKVPKLPFDS